MAAVITVPAATAHASRLPLPRWNGSGAAAATGSAGSIRDCSFARQRVSGLQVDAGAGDHVDPRQQLAGAGRHPQQTGPQHAERGLHAAQVVGPVDQGGVAAAVGEQTLAHHDAARVVAGAVRHHEHPTAEARLLRPAEADHGVDRAIAGQDAAVVARAEHFRDLGHAHYGRVQFRHVGQEAGGIGGDRHLAEIPATGSRQFPGNTAPSSYYGSGRPRRNRIEGRGRNIVQRDAMVAQPRLPRDRAPHRVVQVLAVARLAPGDHAQAQGARPVDQTDQQAVLVAVDRGVDHPGAVGPVLQNRSHADVGFLVDHRHVLAVVNRGHRVARPRLRDPGRLRHQRDRQLHHQLGVFQHHLGATLQGVESGGSAGADRDAVFVDAGMAVCLAPLVDVHVGHH